MSKRIMFMSQRIVFVAVGIAVAAAGGTWSYLHAAEAVPTMDLRDYMEIQQLYSRYVRAADMGGAGDGSDWAGCFTPDGEFGQTKGTEALKTLIHNFHLRVQKEGWSSRHTYSGLLITPTPEGAKGSVYALVFNVTAKPPFVDHSGVYEDWLVKTRDGWRFKRRLFKISGSFKPSMP